jgi:hypothetical protein
MDLKAKKERALNHAITLAEKDINFKMLADEKKDQNKTGANWKLKFFGPEKAAECVERGIHSA